MKFLPFERITYKTALKPAEVAHRLQEITEPKKFIRTTVFGKKSLKQYEGTVDDNSFVIKRIIGYRNSFLPIIKGHVAQDVDGTRISIKMQLSVIVAVFIGFWCAAVGIACVVVLTRSIQLGVFHAYGLLPFGMLLFAYALTMGAFLYEAKRAKKDLTQLWEAHEIKNAY